MKSKVYKHLFPKDDHCASPNPMLISEYSLNQIFSIAYGTASEWSKQLGFMYGLAVREQQYSNALAQNPDNQNAVEGLLSIEKQLKMAESVMCTKTAQLNKIASQNNLMPILSRIIVDDKTRMALVMHDYAEALVKERDYGLYGDDQRKLAL